MTEALEHESGEEVVFIVKVDFGELIECGGIEGLNEIVDEDAYDKYPGLCLTDMSYRPVGVEGENVLVEVSAILEDF